MEMMISYFAMLTFLTGNRNLALCFLMFESLNVFKTLLILRTVFYSVGIRNLFSSLFHINAINKSPTM
jgi:hypothetical protein